MSTPTYTQGDQAPPLPVTATNPDGSTFTGFVGGSNFQLKWWPPDGSGPLLVPLQTVNLSLGQLQKALVVGDTSIPGLHKGRVQFLTAANQQETWPSDGTYWLWYVNPS